MDSIIVNASLCAAVRGRGKHKPVMENWKVVWSSDYRLFADSVIILPVREYTYHRNSE